MRGDFSSWRDERRENFNGVLHQQGRVLLDSDWNEQTRITNDWQDIAGQDIIGGLVAAVPADEPDSYKITKAEIKNGNHVELTVGVGRVWADGLLSRLFGPNAAALEVKRIATYLQPPIQNPPGVIPVNPPNAPLLRDAVILEVWRQEINGFQLPDQLIEPALGGVDTTERVHTGAAFRLMRLKDGDTCESIVKGLQDDFDAKGKLTVKLQTPPPTGGDCEVKAAGGYTGFEHNLYRIEIAQVKSGAAAMFKWSQFNGGLVGRGVFDAANKKVTLTGNIQAILNSGLSSFYLEALQFDPAPFGDYGHWRTTYGARATLDSNGSLSLPIPGSPNEIFGTLTDGTFFFRLWNEVAKIDDFQSEKLLQDGITLDFDKAAAAGLYTPGDYWTFPVRAGEIKNTTPLIDLQPPEGIRYRRVPLATLTWKDDSIEFAKGEIEDCRHLFRPLTRLSTCCTFRVGDGMHSFGDYDSIKKAIEHLPASGGEICLLPGIYKENLKIAHRSNIKIKGCGRRSRIVADTSDPVIHIKESNNIKIETLAVVAHKDGVGILLEGPVPKSGDDNEEKELYLHDITLEKLLVRASTRSGIEAHVGQNISIRDCRIAINDSRTEWAAVYLVGDDCVIEDNSIYVITDDSFFDSADVPEPFLDAGRFDAHDANSARGGLHLGGGCDRVRVINNLIVGGVGDGITLGSVDEKDGDKIYVYYDPWWPVGKDKADCDPKPGHVGGGVIILQGTEKIAGAPLNDILIERNRIFNMGRNGIGIDAFFDLEKADELISVENLSVIGNRIQHCLNRPLVAIPANMTDSMGYGGISLADVDNLVARDNFIEDNGQDYTEPVCGIFVLHGDGIEISRNRIRNNGARNSKPSASAEKGRRGGINIVFGVAPQVEISVTAPDSNKTLSAPFSNGVPAVKIHENIVSAPLGQALSLVALGPVSVVGNQFTSLGMIMQQSSPTFLAATVLIFNLGLSNELWLQALSFLVVQKGQVGTPKNPGGPVDANGNLVQAGLDDERLGQYLANGNVLFTNNQCQLNLLEKGVSIALTSILILSLDDIGFHNNQCDCDLFDDFVLSQALLFGMSVRASDNRFKESILNALYSATTYGWINITTDNQATHCLLIRGRLFLDKQNIILIDSFFNSGPVENIERSFCDRRPQPQGNFARNPQDKTTRAT